MAAPLPLRSDFDADTLRREARRSRDAAQARRRLALAAIYAPGAHAVLLLDQAGSHMSAKLAVPPNITIMPPPPKAPELNPVENLWQFIRDNWLSNRIFHSYDDILDHACAAWNAITAARRFFEYAMSASSCLRPPKPPKFQSRRQLP